MCALKRGILALDKIFVDFFYSIQFILYLLILMYYVLSFLFTDSTRILLPYHPYFCVLEVLLWYASCIWELIQLKNEHKDSIYGNFLKFFDQIFLDDFQQSPATVPMCKKNTEYTCCPRDIKARKVTRDPGSPREIRSGNMSRQKS